MKIGASLTRPRETQSPTQQPPPQLYPTIPGFSPRAEDAFAHVLRGIAPARLVMGAGLCSILIYFGFVLAFPIWRWWNHPHASSDPNIINDMGRITGYSPLAAIAFVAAILALFACQFLALTATAGIKQMGTPRTLKEAFVRYAVFLSPLIFGLIMVWMQPVTTTDLYGYVARGYLFTHLHLNPMTHGAQLLPGGLQVNRPASPYGPVWLIVTALVSLVSGENLLLNMLIYKFIGLATVGVALWLVDVLARTLYPERRMRIYVLFGWSPLLIFESVGNAHNDILMVVCVLGAFALMLRDYARGAFALLVLGALVKYVSAIFVPLWLVYELRHLIPHAAPTRTALAGANDGSGRGVSIRGTRGFVTASHAMVMQWVRSATAAARQADRRAIGWLLAQSALIGIVLVAVAYAPFWDGFNTFLGLTQQIRPRYYNSSLVGFFSGPVQAIMSPGEYEAFDKTVRLVVYVFFAIYAYIQTRGLWQRGESATIRDVITAAAKIACAALLLITFWFQPWYVIWLVPLAALAAEPYVRRQGAILAAGALLTYAVGNFLFVNESDLAHDLFVQFFEILVAFGPLLLLRAAPYDRGWTTILRRYIGLFGEGLSQRPIFWERVMLVLIAIVAALLRLVRLGPLFSVATNNAETNILKQASDDLKLFLADPQGLNGPFVALQGLLLDIFGRNAFAVLLPSAVIGSLTVIAIYMLTYQMMRQGNLPGKGTVALLAALLAATSHWHVSLSRSGMQVVMLPLLMCLAIYWLLLALRMGAITLESTSGLRPASTKNAKAAPKRRHARRHASKRQPTSAGTAASTRLMDSAGAIRIRRRHLFYYVGCGICTGLACDLAPGLWLVPLLVAGMLVVWRWLRPKGLHVSRAGLLALIGSALLTGIPVIWHYISGYIGLPKGSPFLAKGSSALVTVPALLSPAFWGQVAHNAGDVLGLLVSQDYSAGYPSTAGTPIIPPLFQVFFAIGLLVIIVRWRSFGSLALLLLVALPLVASVAVGTPTGVIEAASVLPALSIVPAIGLYQSGRWLSHLPIVLDRINGVRIFSTPEQIGRVLLLMFLVFSTIRTFFWYFEATLPARQKDFVPSWNGSNVVYAQPNEMSAQSGGRLVPSPLGEQVALISSTATNRHS
ncbi:MAG TPA: glycosyltransferase family 39 protein [Ktedonobacterales bacterium]